VECASLPERRTLRGTLAELPQLARRLGSGPAVLLIGEVLRTASAETGFEGLLKLA